ncbi:MAG TPA: hypothetical protein VM347_18205, partial [Nonomuraea sp.]|nr:hypothetical protein [Nonomuraea sp.]
MADLDVQHRGREFPLSLVAHPDRSDETAGEAPLPLLVHGVLERHFLGERTFALGTATGGLRKEHDREVLVLYGHRLI